MDNSRIILGIESSCDDTAAAVVQGRPDNAEILSSIVMDQSALHEAFGGVVPEIAARAHAEKLDIAVSQALAAAGVKLREMDAIAVTSGPGLIGGVVSGVMLAKGLSVSTGKPLVGVNHLAGHALTPRLTDQINFPYLMLLVSGGHCQFLIAHSHEKFERLGGTIDDAPGEAFDKVARLIGLDQPGGPEIERSAKTGDPSRFKLPRPLLNRPDCDMSFSGLKTAVLRATNTLVEEQGGLSAQDQSDLAASFQSAVSETLRKKSLRAIELLKKHAPKELVFAVAGGVASNFHIRAALEGACDKHGVQFVAPPLKLCTDNAAMIAYAGLCRFSNGEQDGLDLSARPRWPLDQSQPSMLGSGKKAAKA